MLMDIENIDKFVKENNIKEITSANIYAIKSTEPDPSGLGSYDIFGRPGTFERKNTFGYISLGDVFIHPHAYTVMVQLKKIINDVAHGNGDFYIDPKTSMFKRLGEGQLPPKGVTSGSGIKYIYDNWEKISFEKEDMSPTVKDRVKLLKLLKKDEIFITKFLIIPPFYRDVDMAGGKKNQINIMYQRLISLATMIRTSGSMLLLQTVSDAHRKLQDTLIEIYDYFVKFTAGTKGFIHLHVMGKPTDFSARMVISTPTINANTANDMEVSFDRSALPLHVAIKCFAPFIVREFKEYVINKLAGSKFLYFKGKTWTRVELADHYQEELMSENIYRQIDLYYDSKEHRLDHFTLLGADETRIPLFYRTTENNIVSSGDESITTITNKVYPMTMCELFYIVAMNSIKNKAICITRYPIEDYHNIYPSKMNIIPCLNTKKVIIDNVEYPHFPSLEGVNESNIESIFIDTLRVFPTYLAALGADFDGDTVSIQGVWGNDEADEYIYSKRNMINIAGNSVRTTKDITPHTVYALTRMTPPPIMSNSTKEF